MRYGGLAALVVGIVLASGCFQEEAPRREAPAVASSRFVERMPASERTTSATREDSAPASAPLAETIRHAEDPAARREALYAMADAGQADASAVVGEALTDPDAEVRMAAVEALTGFGGTASADWLAIALGDPDARVRRTAVEALGEIGGDSARMLLQQALGDTDREVREAAAEMLSEPEFALGEVR